MTVPVRVTHHAIDRARERVPGWERFDPGTLRRRLIANTVAALERGQVSRLKPSFVVMHERELGLGDHHYAWIDETRCLVLRRKETCWLVLTVLVPPVAEAA